MTSRRCASIDLPIEMALADGGAGADLGGAAAIDAEVAVPEVVAAGEGDGAGANAEWDGRYKEIEAKFQLLQGIVRWEVTECFCWQFRKCGGTRSSWGLPSSI